MVLMFLCLLVSLFYQGWSGIVSPKQKHLRVTASYTYDVFIEGGLDMALDSGEFAELLEDAIDGVAVGGVEVIKEPRSGPYVTHIGMVE